MVTFGGYVMVYRSHKGDGIAGLPGAVEKKRGARSSMEQTASDLRNMAGLLYDQMHNELGKARTRILPPGAAELS